MTGQAVQRGVAALGPAVGRHPAAHLHGALDDHVGEVLADDVVLLYLTWAVVVRGHLHPAAGEVALEFAFITSSRNVICRRKVLTITADDDRGLPLALPPALPDADFTEGLLPAEFGCDRSSDRPALITCVGVIFTGARRVTPTGTTAFLTTGCEYWCMLVPRPFIADDEEAAAEVDGPAWLGFPSSLSRGKPNFAFQQAAKRRFTTPSWYS